MRSYFFLRLKFHTIKINVNSSKLTNWTAQYEKIIVLVLPHPSPAKLPNLLLWYGTGKLRLSEENYQSFDNSIMIYIELIGTLQKLLYFIFTNHSLKTG